MSDFKEPFDNNLTERNPAIFCGTKARHNIFIKKSLSEHSFLVTGMVRIHFSIINVLMSFPLTV